MKRRQSWSFTASQRVAPDEFRIGGELMITKLDMDQRSIGNVLPRLPVSRGSLRIERLLSEG